MPYRKSPDKHASQSVIRSYLIRYGLAVALIVAAILIRDHLHEIIEGHSVAAFMAAILLVAWFGGVGPAILCLVALHISHGYWFQTTPALFEPHPGSFITTAGWYVIGILSQKRTAAQSRAQREHLDAVSQREHLHTTLSCMADGVLVTDTSGRITLMNRAAENLTGWTKIAAVGRPWHEVLAVRAEGEHPSAAGVHPSAQEAIDRVLRTGAAAQESTPLVLVSRTGRTIPVAYSAAPVESHQSHDPPPAGMVLVFRDESDRRRAELALQSADRRKDEFLATLAHELRNPLAPICMGLDLLHTSAGDPQAAADVRQMMQRQTHHMVRLIDDLLDVSRITRGKLELRKTQVDLAEVVRDALAATKPLLDQAKHQLTVRLPEQPVLLYADASRLTQVITNLLNNAAKYTPREGRIELAIEPSGGQITLTVSDSGIGIPADKIDDVFEMFTQINETREYGHTGLGIGLTLVKRLVEMHGGSVEAKSRGRNLGATFVVRLPVLSMPHSETNGSPTHSHTAPNAIKRRVLVVDDNADALEALSRMVKLMGNEVRSAHDGQEALHLAESFKPDVVLMDLGMPNLNGYDAARVIRQQPWGRDLVLIATTGWGQEDDRQRTAEAGFNRHLVKPIALDQLRQALESAPIPSSPSNRPAVAATD